MAQVRHEHEDDAGDGSRQLREDGRRGHLQEGMRNAISFAYHNVGNAGEHTSTNNYILL